MKSMTIKTKEIKVGLAQLMLDPNNYRLNKGEEEKIYSDDEILEAQNDTQQKLISENISDLETSILKNGFLQVDKIVVKELKNLSVKTDYKSYVLIEGNRRTAAFKSVISEFYNEEREEFEEGFPESLQEKYKNINVILVEGSEDEIKDYAQRLMGIRHVSGPRQWGGYQSAKLINDMSAQGYKKIGTLLGMRPNEAQRRHEAFLAIQQMKRDPEYKDKASPKLFTLFAEIVASNKYFKEQWLGWNSDTKEFTEHKNRHRIYDAILPDDNGNQEVNNPSKLRYFAKCINIDEVRAQLETGVLLSDIDYDFDVSARVKKIADFLNFTRKQKTLSDQEVSLYKELHKEMAELLEGLGE